MTNSLHCRAVWLIGVAVCGPAVAGCSEPQHVALAAQLTAPEADARREAALALAELREAAMPAVPALITASEDGDATVRQAVCRALGDIGDPAAEVLPTLERCLDDDQLAVRLAAAFALLKLQPESPAPQAALISAMRQGEGGTIVAIGQLGSAARWAVPTLTALLRDRRPGLRRISAEALGRIGPDAAAAEALRIAAEKDPDDRVREAAAAAVAMSK